MSARESFLATMRGEPGSHTVKWEFGYWVGTVRRWYAQGLPRVKGISDDAPDGKGVKGELQGRTPSRMFDEDVRDAMNMDEANEAIPVEAFIHPPFDRIVLEDHDYWQIVRSMDGTIMQERKDGLSVPSFLRGPISNADEWHKLRDERLIPVVRDRLVTNWETWSKRVQERTHTV